MNVFASLVKFSEIFFYNFIKLATVFFLQFYSLKKQFPEISARIQKPTKY